MKLEAKTRLTAVGLRFAPGIAKPSTLDKKFEDQVQTHLTTDGFKVINNDGLAVKGADFAAVVTSLKKFAKSAGMGKPSTDKSGNVEFAKSAPTTESGIMLTRSNIKVYKPKGKGKDVTVHTTCYKVQR